MGMHVCNAHIPKYHLLDLVWELSIEEEEKEEEEEEEE